MLAQIVASEPKPEKATKSRGAGRTREIAWGVLAAAVIGAAAFAAVHFLTGSAKDDLVSRPAATSTAASTETSSAPSAVTSSAVSTVTSAASSSAEAVTVGQALWQIVHLAESTPTIGIGEPGPELKGLLEEAQVWGLLRKAERASIQLDQPATRKQFALWLWRCFGRVLTETTPLSTVSDLGSLTAEEQRAVVGLVRDGVIRLPENGVFGGDQLLTWTQAFDLLARVKALLLGTAPGASSGS